MKKPTRALTLLLAVMLCLTPAGMAAETQTPAQNPAPVITAIQNSDALSAIPVQVVPPSGELFSVYDLAYTMQSVSATVEREGVPTAETLGVGWDFSGVDAATEGTYAAVGVIEAPEGYRFADGVLTEIHIPVQVAVPSTPIIITSVETWPPHADALAVLQGSSPEEIVDYFKNAPVRLECCDSSGTRYLSQVEWDFSGIDLSTVGLYDAVGTLPAPKYTVFAPELVPPTLRIPVSVQAQDQPDLNCFYTGRGIFRFPWVSPPGDLTEIQVWLSENGGAWRQLDEEVHVEHFQLDLRSSALTRGNSYRLQVDYDGGRTGVLSFTYDDTILVDNYAEGDRDGGDADGLTPGGGDTVQKPPASNGGGDSSSGETGGGQGTPETTPPPATPEPVPTTEPLPSPDPAPEPSTQTPPPAVEPTPAEKPAQPKSPAKTDAPSAPAMAVPASSETDEFLEVFGENRDLISGTRLLLMLETTGEARFTKQGVTVCFSAEALRAQTIQDSDRIEITIEQEAQDTVFLSISINDVPLCALPDTRLMVPYHASDAEAAVLLTDEQGEEVAKGEYDAALAVVSFRVDAPGRFSVVEQTTTQPRASAAKSDPQPQAGGAWTPWLLLPLGGALLAMGGWRLLKRRRNK